MPKFDDLGAGKRGCRETLFPPISRYHLTPIGVRVLYAFSAGATEQPRKKWGGGMMTDEEVVARVQT